MSREYQYSDQYLDEVASRQFQVSDTFVNTTVVSTFTATVGLTSQASTLVATTTFSAGTHTASVGLTTQTSTLAATTTFSPGTHTASVGLVSQSSTLSATTTFSGGTHTAVGALVGSSSTLAATVTFVGPSSFTAVTNLVSSSSTLAASGTVVNPQVTATVGLITKTSLLSSSVTFVGAGGVGPDTPTLSIDYVGAGLTTATISESSVGSFNVVYVQDEHTGIWVNVGDRTSDGDVSFTLSSFGRFYAYVLSTLNSQSVVSNVVLFWALDNEESNDAVDHSPADIIRWLLISQGRGTDPGDSDDWPIFSSSEPSIPDNCVTTYDTSGVLQGRIQYSGEMSEHFGFQIRVRGKDHVTAWRKANELKTHLDQGVLLDTVNINSSIYLVEAITRSGGILALGKETNSQRLVFTLNATVALRQIA